MASCIVKYKKIPVTFTGMHILNLKKDYKLTLTNPVTLRSEFTDFT